MAEDGRRRASALAETRAISAMPPLPGRQELRRRREDAPRQRPRQRSVGARVSRLGEPRLIDAVVLDDAHHVVARLVERDALDPIDEIGAGARVAIGVEPLRDPSGAGVIGGGGELQRAALGGDELAEIGRAELHVVAGVGDQPRVIVRHAGLARGVGGGARQDLHEALGARPRGRARQKFALLPRHRHHLAGARRARQRLVVRQAEGREGDGVEREAALGGELAERRR